MIPVPGSPGSSSAPFTLGDFPATPAPDDALEICAACHPESPLRLFYHQGLLVVRCQACEAVILHIAVAPGPR